VRPSSTLILNGSAFFPTQRNDEFCIILPIKTDHFHNNIKRLAFVMDTQCVFCEVGTELLHLV